ncbi:DUF6457 domain-containing protein [Oerskovia sp. M15]
MSNLERWVDALVNEFDLDREAVDIGAILDLARDAAHRVERPAAPDHVHRRLRRRALGR